MIYSLAISLLCSCRTVTYALTHRVENSQLGFRFDQRVVPAR